MAVVQRRPETLRWFREVVAGPPTSGRGRRERQARKTDEEIAAAVLAAMNDGPTPFLHLRRLLGVDAATLARALGVLTMRGLVELGGIPARWRLTDQEIREALKRAKGVVERTDDRSGPPPQPDRPHSRHKDDSSSGHLSQTATKAALDREVARRTGKTEPAVKKARQRAEARAKGGAGARQRPASPGPGGRRVCRDPP